MEKPQSRQEQEWGEEDGKKKEEETLQYVDTPYVKSKYNKRFFAETIPKAKDRKLMVPFCPLNFYNIYLNKNRYQGVYSIEFLDY